MSAYLRTISEDLFTKPAFRGMLESCRAQGQAAYDQAFGRDQNPYPIGSAEREWYDAGWCESQENLLGEK